MPPTALIKPVSVVYKPPAKPVVIAPQNIGTPSAYVPPAPYTGNNFGNLGIEGSGFATSQNPAPPAPAPAAAAAPPPPAAPIDWEKQIAGDPEGALQQGYLDRANTMTTEALRKAWLGHTQSSQDSFNAHGGLFSGAMAQAQSNSGDDYKNQLKAQALNYDKGGHDIHTSVLHRLMLQLTGVDDLMGK